MSTQPGWSSRSVYVCGHITVNGIVIYWKSYVKSGLAKWMQLISSAMYTNETQHMHVRVKLPFSLLSLFMMIVTNGGKRWG